MPERNRERGAAAVEMAFMAIFLLILVTGILDVGRAIFTDISIQEAAQEGAYFGAFEEDATEADISQRAVDSTSSPDLDSSHIEVDCVSFTKSKQAASRVTVTVTHELDLITPLVGQWLGGSMTLSKTAEADRFFPNCPA